MSSVREALDLAILRLNQQILTFPPFSEHRRDLVRERNVLADSRHRLLALLPDDRPDSAA